MCLFIQQIARASVDLTVKRAVNLTCHDAASDRFIRMDTVI